MRARVGPALRLYAAALRTLPAWLRQRAGDEMLATFEERLHSADGWRERAAVTVREIGGVLRAAVSARVSGRSPAADGNRGRRRHSRLESLAADARFASRAMRRAPAVPLLAVLTLALGVGAGTAMFSVVDGVLLKPLPYPEAERVVLVRAANEEWRGHPSLHGVWNQARISYPEFSHWAEHQQSFEAVAAFSGATGRIPTPEGATQVGVLRGTPEIFRILAVAPALGRVFEESDTEPVIVLSYDFWQSRYGGDADVLGQLLELRDVPHRIIGVMPRGFEVVGFEADLLEPLIESPGNMANINNHSLLGIGRLRPGVGIDQAEQETARLLRQASAGAARHDLTHGASVVSLLDDATRGIRLPLLILTVASLVLLLAACANVALLLLGTGADRVRELSVRGALGAHRARIAQQLMVESLTLAAVGAAAGLLLAAGLTRLLLLMAPPDTPRLAGVAIDLRAFAFAAGVAALCGILAGCFPALSLSRVQAAAALRAGATAPGRGRAQRAIVVGELALATVLLVGAGLLTRTLGELERVEPGYHAAGVTTVTLALPWDRMTRPGQDRAEFAQRLEAYAATITEELRGIPGVDDVALTSSMPFSADRATTEVAPEGYVPADGERIAVAWRYVSGNYFDLLRISPMAGRVLTTADDRAGSEPAMVITDRFGRHFWPDGRWVGRTVEFWGTVYRVVGVIADTREQDLRGDDDAFKFYVAARGSANVGSRYLLRSQLPVATLAPLIRERVAATDRGIVVERIESLEQRMAESVAEYRYRMRLMQAFAATSALFCLLGVYGVMSRAVNRRRQELGLRLALGARPGDIARLVLREGLWIGGAGAGVGVLGAFAGARALDSLLWGVPATDPLTFATIACGLLVLALLATWSPAARAASVDPISTLHGS